VCRHAAGLLRAKGHRRIAFLTPQSSAAGDLVSEEGFLQGLGQANDAARTEGIIVRHSGTASNLTAKLDALFASNHPPTALLVAKPRHVFFVVGYLLRHGIKSPGRISLIARDYDPHFEQVISHYRFEGESFAHRLSRLMLQMANKGFLQKEPNLIFPRYVAEGTVERYWV